MFEVKHPAGQNLKTIWQQLEVQLAVSGVPGISLDGVPETIAVDGGGMHSLPVRVRADRENAYGIMEILFTVTALDDEGTAVSEDSRFLGPTP